MAVQYSTTYRNAILDQFETTVGTSARLIIYTGAPPANCAAAASGTVLADITCPVDWAANASGGSKVYTPVWQDLVANNTGTAGHFRIWDSAVAVCHMQGTYGTAGTDMIGDSVSFTAGQTFLITAFTQTAPGA